MTLTRLWIASGVTCWLFGCAVGPDYAPPEIDLPAAYATSLERETATQERWWLGFEDEALNALIAEALEENLDIEAALARIEEAGALVRAERSDLFPRIDGFAQWTGETTLSGDGGSSDSAFAGGAFSFVPDIFGGQRRRLQAARARADADIYFSADVRRLVISEVALQYVALRRSEERLALLETSLELQDQTLEIVRGRFEAGLAADLDVGRAFADLARTRAQRGPLEIARAQAAHALDVLLARPPGGDILSNAEDGIPAFSAGPPAGVPADLVRRRADVRAAEAELIAATADIGVEAADLYPSLSLPGEISADISDASNIADPVIGVLTASLDAPLFDAGRRRAEVRAAEARARAALADYEQTLLNSLREVENALVAINSFEDRLKELESAVEASERAFEQLNALYREGLATFIDILDAQRTLIASREAYVDSQADLAAAIVALYAALGYGDAST